MYPREMDIRTGSRPVLPKAFRGASDAQSSESRTEPPPSNEILTHPNISVDQFRKKEDKVEEGHWETPMLLRYKPGRCRLISLVPSALFSSHGLSRGLD